MNDFKTIAKTGPDFVNIIFEQAADDVDNIIIEVFVDGMKMKTVLCESTDTSLTLQPLADGEYTYKISHITESSVKTSSGSFKIKDYRSRNNDAYITY